MAAESTMEKLLDLAREFVIAKKGEWGHEDWEKLLTQADALGMELTDENKRSLGNILEVCKWFYACGYAKASPEKKAAAKAKRKSR